jgi:Protein of Unknown function (DUF2784)
MQSHHWADLVVLIHAAFVLFVVFGGLAVLRWRRMIWFHLPAALWGLLIELSGWICPLTHLENYLRRSEEGGGYSATFIEYYLEPILYPLGMTRHIQILLAIIALMINLLIYVYIWKSRRRNQL